MAITELSTFTDTGNYEMSVDLDGTVYILIMTYNPRDSHWYLSFETQDGTAIRSGIKLTTGNPLMAYWRALGRPLGELFMLDPSGAGLEASFETIGVDVFLTYVDQESLFEAGEAAGLL